MPRKRTKTAAPPTCCVCGGEAALLFPCGVESVSPSAYCRDCLPKIDYAGNGMVRTIEQEGSIKQRLLCAIRGKS